MVIHYVLGFFSYQIVDNLVLFYFLRGNRRYRKGILRHLFYRSNINMIFSLLAKSLTLPKGVETILLVLE